MIEDNVRTAFFEVTGLSVPLPQGWHFHDEGASRPNIFADRDAPQSIEARNIEIFLDHTIRYLTQVERMSPEDAYEVAKSMAEPFIVAEIQSRKTQYGSCLPFLNVNYGDGPESHIHILYIDRGRPDFNVALRAHEEFHALKLIPSAVQSLEQHILDSQGASIDFGRISNQEVAAWCNAVFALHAHGMDVHEVHSTFGSPGFRRDFGKAMKIYQRGLNGHRPGLLGALGRLISYRP